MITPKLLTENGFIWNGDTHVFSFQRDGLCIAVVENKWSFINYFTTSPLPRYILTISGMDVDSDCFTYRVQTMQEIVDYVDNFEPKKKKVNIFLAKMFTIIVIVIIISILISL